MREEWRDIPGTGDLYEASSLGRIRSKDRIVTRRSKSGHLNQYYRAGVVLKPLRATHGYLMVGLHYGEGRVMTTVHKLVALAWLNENPGRREINHRDGNKLNNRPENLEWVTHSENILHAQAMGLKRDQKPVIARPAVGGCPIKFVSVNEAARVLGGSQSNISRALLKGRGTAHGHVWAYAEAA